MTSRQHHFTFMTSSGVETKSVWLRPNEVILVARHQKSWMSICSDDLNACGVSDVYDRSSQMALHLLNICFILYCFHTNYSHQLSPSPTRWHARRSSCSVGPQLLPLMHLPLTISPRENLLLLSLWSFQSFFPSISLVSLQDSHLQEGNHPSCNFCKRCHVYITVQYTPIPTAIHNRWIWCDR